MKNDRLKKVTIVGAGFTGLVVALICARKGMSVKVIEKRDLITSSVSQSDHVHMLTKKGLSILQELFPSIEVDYLTNRFVKIHFTKEVKWVGPYQEYPMFCSDFGDIYTFYRPELDQVLIDMIKQYDCIELHMGVEFKEAQRDQNAIKRILTSAGEFESDLLLITVGRNGDFEKLLNGLNIQGCEKVYIPSKLKYRSFEMESDYFSEREYKAIMATTFGEVNPNGSVIIPVGEKKYRVTQVGQDISDDIYSFAAKLHTQEISNILKESQILSIPTTYHLLGSRKFNFKNVTNWPEGLVMLGDAAVFINPIFAQGLTLSLMQCDFLDKFLNSDKSTLSFQKRIDHLIKWPWYLGTLEDRRLNAKFWQKPFYFLAEKFLASILKKATQDKVTYLKLVEHLNMMTEPKPFLKFYITKLF